MPATAVAGAEQPEVEVLRSLPSRGSRTRFLVVDEITGEPVESFGLVVVRDGGSAAARRSQRRPLRYPVGEHPGGESVVTARPGLDAVHLTGPDHPPFHETVRHDRIDADGLGVHLVRLPPGARITGRLMAAESPLVAAVIETVNISASQPPWEDVRVVSDAEGRFLVRGVRPGRHIFQARAGPRGLTMLHVEAVSGAIHDLGDIQVEAAAALTLQVGLPAESPTAGVVVVLNRPAPLQSLRASLRPDSTADFGLLPAGFYGVDVEKLPEGASPVAPRAVELAPGERSVIVLDATPQSLSHLRLSLQLHDLDMEYWRVDFEPLEWPPALRRPNPVSAVLGPEGRLDGYFPALGSVRPVLRAGTSGPFTHPNAHLLLEPGGRTEAKFEFPSSTLELILPAHIADLEQDSLSVLLALRSETGDHSTLRFTAARHGRVNNELRWHHGLEYQRPQADRLILAPLPPGNYRALVILHGSGQSIRTNGTESLGETTSSMEALSLELPAGGRQVVRLP